MKTALEFKTFALAGNAIFTVTSLKSQTRYTYRVRQSKNKEYFFVSVLTGSDNTSDYTFLDPAVVI